MHDIGRTGYEVGLRLITTREIRLRVASGFRELFGNLGAISAVQRIGTKNSTTIREPKSDLPVPIRKVYEWGNANVIDFGANAGLCEICGIFIILH